MCACVVISRSLIHGPSLGRRRARCKRQECCAASLLQLAHSRNAILRCRRSIRCAGRTSVRKRCKRIDKSFGASGRQRITRHGEAPNALDQLVLHCVILDTTELSVSWSGCGCEAQIESQEACLSWFAMIYASNAVAAASVGLARKTLAPDWMERHLRLLSWRALCFQVEFFCAKSVGFRMFHAWHGLTLVHQHSTFAVCWEVAAPFPSFAKGCLAPRKFFRKLAESQVSNCEGSDGGASRSLSPFVTFITSCSRPLPWQFLPCRGRLSHIAHLTHNHQGCTTVKPYTHLETTQHCRGGRLISLQQGLIALTLSSAVVRLHRSITHELLSSGITISVTYPTTYLRPALCPSSS